MNYRKPLKNGGYAIYNGSFIRVGNTTIVNPTEQMLLDNGYEPYTQEPQPKDTPSTDEMFAALRQLNAATLASLPDEEALAVAAIYPTWFSRIGQTVAVDERYWYNEQLYRCVQAHTVQADWTPDVTPALWTVVSLDEWPEWVQPTGASDAYAAGAKVSHNDKHWISLIDNNVWEPGATGTESLWQEVS